MSPLARRARDAEAILEVSYLNSLHVAIIAIIETWRKPGQLVEAVAPARGYDLIVRPEP
jgi:hypothetical protein